MQWSTGSKMVLCPAALLQSVSPVAQSRPTLCDPVDCSMPGLPLHHQLLELAQTHVHQVSDAIQPSHPLLSPSPPAFNLSQHQGLFQRVSSSIRGPKDWSFSSSPCSEPSRTDWLHLLAFPLWMLAGRAQGCWVASGYTEQATRAPSSCKKGSPLSRVKGTHKGCPGQSVLPSPHGAESMRMRHGDLGGGDPQSPFIALCSVATLASPQL